MALDQRSASSPSRCLRPGKLRQLFSEDLSDSEEFTFEKRSIGSWVVNIPCAAVRTRMARANGTLAPKFGN